MTKVSKKILERIRVIEMGVLRCKVETEDSLGIAVMLAFSQQDRKLPDEIHNLNNSADFIA